MVKLVQLNVLMLLLLMLITSTYSSVESSSAVDLMDSLTETLESHKDGCGLKVYIVDSIQLACVKSHKCAMYTAALKFNETCWKLHDKLTEFNCCNQFSTIIYKINTENKDLCHNVFSHSWCIFFSNLLHVIIAILVWLIMATSRVGVLHLFRVIDILSGYIIKKKNKCGNCLSEYRFTHMDCNMRTSKRTDYNLTYYFIVVLIMFLLPMFLVPVLADDSKFNTYDHSGYTEFIIKDVEHEINDFYQKTNHITVTVEKSYIVYETSYSHNILKKLKDIVTDKNYSCKDDEMDCFKSLKGDNKTFRSIKKNHDGFACLLQDALVCVSCGFEYEVFGKVYNIISHKPVIKIKVVINNDVPYNITVDSYEDYIDGNFYIKSINAIDHDDDLIFIKGDIAYKGKICIVPSTDCFGRHILKDDKVMAIYNPLIKDNNYHDTSAELVQCTEDENLDVLRLNRIGLINYKGLITEDRTFGRFSIGVRSEMLLDDKICDKGVTVTKVTADGCHNCKYGFDLTVDFKTYASCGRIDCATSIYKTYTYVTNDRFAKVKLYSDTKVTKVTCNGREFTVTLNDQNINSYYHSGSYMSGNSDIKNRLKSVLDFAIYDKLKMMVLIITLVLMIYVFGNLIMKFRSLTRREYNKVVHDPRFLVDMSRLREVME
uniref:Glycoprotein n=1 Tax=Jujube yellow mottle-associated virus TaxID=2595002 RepID=A0A7T4WRV3_9VIRU|nr:glycoprotein precursor [Jujube yellow mottle-associated virus]